MKGRKFLQIFLGIISAIITIALGSVSVLLILPFLAKVTVSGLLLAIETAITDIATAFGLAGLEYVIVLVTMVLPTVFMVISTNCLLFAKKGSGRATGVVFGLLALVIFGGFTGWFSKQLMGDLQMIYLIVLGATALLYLILTVIFAIVCKKVKKQTACQTVEQPITEQSAVEQPLPTAPVEQPTETPDGEVLYMAQDYSSVSDVSDATYQHNEVLSNKVLAKLKIARDLYEKGAISKDEYLNLVQKYLEEAE